MLRGGKALGPNYARALPDFDAVALDVGGAWVLVDAADYPRIRGMRWFWIDDKIAANERFRGKVHKVYLGKFLLDTPDHVHVERIEKNFLGDYRRSNLRIRDISGIAKPKWGLKH